MILDEKKFLNKPLNYIVSKNREKKFPTFAIWSTQLLR